MAAAGGGHTGGLEDVPLQEFLVGDAGEPLHQQGQQVVAGVGVVQPLPRGEVGLRLGLPEEAHYLAVARHPLLLLPDADEPVRVVEVIGDAAGMVQKMPDGHALVGRELREILRDPVLQAQLSLPHRQQRRRPCERLADGGQLKDGVLRDGQRVPRVPEAHSALRYDLALLGVEPGPVEAVLFLQRPGQVFHHFMFIHRCYLLFCCSSQLQHGGHLPVLLVEGLGDLPEAEGSV